MLAASCHCGDVRIEVPSRPDTVTLCNCSICRRLGALWAYYMVGTVRVIGDPENTNSYIWGDKTLRTVRRRRCGCVTHWEPLKPDADGHMAVNVRNFDPEELDELRIRRFDGARSWRYVD
jgi:hypothetical protein